MAGRPKIECDIHDLLDEANSLLLSENPDIRETATLIGRLRNCADQASEAALSESAARMRKAADELERRLIHEP